MRWEAIVGRNVRSLRKARGLTQEALAHAAEIDARYVGGIERGEENPTVAFLDANLRRRVGLNVRKFRGELGISQEQLAFGSGRHCAASSSLACTWMPSTQK
jgi:predicted transcriptional regulator